jgi:hypothetical protein
VAHTRPGDRIGDDRGAHLLYGTIAIWWLATVAALVAVAISALARTVSARGASGNLTLALALVSLLAIPTWASVGAIEAKLSDAGNVGALPPREVSALSRYLRTHQGNARYEVAAASSTKIAALIVRDGRPVLVLTSYLARPLTPVAKLRSLVAAGQVRYAFLDSPCGSHTPRTDAGCSAAARWVRAHGADVSRQAGLTRGGLLWRLPTAAV